MGKTASIHAVEKGHDIILEMLMDKGADLSVIDNVSELLT